jgi:hypothetical protein
MMETNEHRTMLRGIREELKNIREINLKLLSEMIEKLDVPTKCCNEARDKNGSLDPRLCGHWKDPHAVG